MEEFERLLMENRRAIERFVYYKLPSKWDADDVLQETCLTAQLKFPSLKDKTAFKAWILAIARNKCHDYFREKAKALDIALDDVSEDQFVYGWQGFTENTAREILVKLKDKDKQILYLYFFEDLPQIDIARKLGIPIGTVRSRLYTAKARFKEKYTHTFHQKEETKMDKLPEYLPEYTIEPSDKEPFAVHHEELPGMLIIPRLKESLHFGMYDFPNRNLTGVYHLETTGEVVLHGVQGVEIHCVYTSPYEKGEDRTIFAQLTDSFCRYLGGMSVDASGVRRIVTFVDGDEFSMNYAIGEDNCGFEVNRTKKEISNGVMENC